MFPGRQAPLTRKSDLLLTCVAARQTDCNLPPGEPPGPFLLNARPFCFPR